MKKLTQEQCAEIFAARKIHRETSVKVLAKKYGVSVHVIYEMDSRKCYLPSRQVSQEHKEPA